MVFERPLTAPERAELEQVLWEAWDHELQKRGVDSLRGPGCVVKQVTAAEGLGWYLTKVGERSLGLEMARGDLKTGRKQHRTPEQILMDAAATGDFADIKLWREYEAATKGRRMVTWSQGLRDRLRAPAVEATDQELAEVEVGGELMAALDTRAWRAVEAASPGAVAVLEAAEGGERALSAYLTATVPPDGRWWTVEPRARQGPSEGAVAPGGRDPVALGA
jgi:hypothetical protein